MRSDGMAISARKLTKTYRLFGHPGDRVKQAMTFGLRRYHREFTALRDVSFDVKKGETVGVIGRNGSGKSTLLQLICGILKPTSGALCVNGRVSALLELGAGFNPDFTGRENVYFHGALMGLKQEELDKRFDDIAAFADIGEFIDQPVRTYSSGMFVRLAFSVAVQVDPEILVIDEALAVGDVRFQSRCFSLLNELKAQSKTIIFVSHALEQIVQLCDRALLFERGELVTHGISKEVANRYLDMAQSNTAGVPLAAEMQHAQRAGDLQGSRGDPRCSRRASHVAPKFHLRNGYNPGEYRWGDQSAQILDFSVTAGSGAEGRQFQSGERAEVTLHVAFLRHVERPVYGLTLKSPDGIILFGTNSRAIDPSRPASPAQSAGDVVRVTFSIFLRLVEGEYFLSVGVDEDAGDESNPLDHRYDAIHISITGARRHIGFVDLAPVITITPGGV